MVYKICFENFVTYNGKTYKCHLCEANCDNFDLVIKHISIERHKRKLEESEQHNERIIASNWSNCQFEKTVKNFITYDDQCAAFICHCCNVKISGSLNVFEHIKGSKHRFRLISVIESGQEIKDDRTNIKGTIYLNSDLSFCNICKCTIFGAANVSDHTDGYNHQKALNSQKIKNISDLNREFTNDQTNLKFNFVDINYCKLCQVFLKNNRFLQCHSMLHVYTTLNMDSRIDIIKFGKKKDGSLIVQCRLCNIFLKDDQELSEHLLTFLHSSRLDIFNSEIHDSSKIIISDVKLGSAENIEVDKVTVKKVLSEINENISTAYYCTICHVSILGTISVNEHASGKKHKTNLNEWESEKMVDNKGEIGTDDFNYYSCFICKLSFSNMSVLLQHYKSNQHIYKIKCFDIIYKSPHTEFVTVDKRVIIKCNLCNVSGGDCKTFLPHLIGKRHRELAELNSNCLPINDESSSNTVDDFITLENIDSSNIENASKKASSKCDFVSIHYCKLCQVFLNNKRALQCHSMFHVNRTLSADSITDIIKFFSNKNSLVLKCLLCKIIFTDFQNLSEHLVSSMHFIRRNFFTRKMYNSCKNIISTKELEDIQNIKLSNAGMKKTVSYLSKNISVAYKCLRCNVPVSSMNLLKQHALGKKHKNNSIGSDSKELLVDKLKVGNEDFYYYFCFICNLSFSGLPQLLQHYNSIEHKCLFKCFNMLDKSPYVDFVTQDEEKISCYLCNVQKLSHTEIIPHLLGKKHCKLAQVKSTDSLQSDETNSAVQNSVHKNNKLLTVDEFAASDKDEAIKVLQIPKHQTLKEHVKQNFELSFKHSNPSFKEKLNSEHVDFKTLFENSIAKSKFKNFYTCYTCSYEMPSNRNEIIEIHLRENANHCANRNSTLCSLEELVYKNLVENSIVFKKNNYFCNFCEKQFNDLNEVKSHLNSFEHNAQLFMISNADQFCLQNTIIQKNRQQLTSSSKLAANDFTSKTLNSQNNEVDKKVKNTSEELRLFKDNKKLMKVINVAPSKKIMDAEEFHTNSEELIKLGFSAENLQSLDFVESANVDDVLNDLVELKLDKKQIKQLPLVARGKKLRTPKFNNEQNSFAQNALLYGKRYTEYCIDSGEKNIYNVDRERVNLIELGVFLSFPYSSNQICLPCGCQFLDQNALLFEHLQTKEHVNNLIELKANDEEFADFPDQCSDLKLARFYMQEETDDLVHCYACNVKIQNNNADILSHMETLTHVSKSDCWKKRSDAINQEFSLIIENIWYYAQKFFCEVCKVRCNYEIDFIIHLESSSHIKDVKKLKQSGAQLKFDSCYSCIIFWYGKSDYYDRHCEDYFHKRFLRNGDFTVPEMSVTASDFLTDINTKMATLINESDKVQLEKFKESYLLKDIEETVELNFHNAKAYTFGSRISFLGFPDSDVDVFLDFNNSYYENIPPNKSEEYLVVAQQLFESKPKLWYVEESLRATRVPILKMKHLLTGLKCDISFTNGLGVEKSSLIR